MPWTNVLTNEDAASARKLRRKSNQKIWTRNNRTRVNARNAAWKNKNPLKFKESQRKYKYGITQVEWDFMFESQGRCCAICKTTKPGSNRDWHTDHKGKKVRGILCFGCNTKLATIENIEFRQAAIAYLERAA
jgi:hypothetical protein